MVFSFIKNKTTQDYVFWFGVVYLFLLIQYLFLKKVVFKGIDKYVDVVSGILNSEVGSVVRDYKKEKAEKREKEKEREVEVEELNEVKTIVPKKIETVYGVSVKVNSPNSTIEARKILEKYTKQNQKGAGFGVGF